MYILRLKSLNTYLLTYVVVFTRWIINFFDHTLGYLLTFLKHVIQLRLNYYQRNLIYLDYQATNMKQENLDKT